MAGGGGGTEELNLVPYLDIMVNLIMFMVVVTAYLVQLKEAPIIAPTYGGAGGGGEQPPFITVAIATTEINLLAGGPGAMGSEPLPKCAMKGPCTALTRRLRELRTAIPDVSENLVVTADKTVPYWEIVKVMDAARSDKQGPLFPAITLATSLSQ